MEQRKHISSVKSNRKSFVLYSVVILLSFVPLQGCVLCFIAANKGFNSW